VDGRVKLKIMEPTDIASHSVLITELISENWFLLGCDTLSLDEWLPTFRSLKIKIQYFETSWNTYPNTQYHTLEQPHRCEDFKPRK
jgi:hypothetical protein